jgi:competence protein ComEA
VGWWRRVGGASGLGGARLSPGRRGVRVLVVVTVLVVVVAGYLAWQARPQPVPVVASASAATPTAEPGAGDGGSGSGTSSDLSAAASPSGMPVVVAVVGKVRRPGVVSLPAGARVADAVRAAGGLLPGADPGFLNLARKVVDGEEIAVGVTPPHPARRLPLHRRTPAGQRHR